MPNSLISLQSPDSGVGVWCLACGVVCVVRPFPGGRHSRVPSCRGAARGARSGRAHARPAMGPDAVNG